MNMYTDFYCEDCQKEWTHEKKERHHAFPIHPNCPICGKNNTYRRWGSFQVKVKKGKLGNAANGYTTEK